MGWSFALPNENPRQTERKRGMPNNTYIYETSSPLSAQTGALVDRRERSRKV